MATVQIEAFLVWHKEVWSEQEEWLLSWSDMACLGASYACAGKKSVTVDIPDDFDPRSIQITNLRAEQSRIRAESEVKVNNLEEQIQRLLCIEAPREPDPEANL